MQSIALCLWNTLKKTKPYLLVRQCCSTPFFAYYIGSANINKPNKKAMNTNMKGCGSCGKPSRPAARPTTSRPATRPVIRPSKQD